MLLTVFPVWVIGIIREQVLLALVKQQGREPDLLLWIENAYF